MSNESNVYRELQHHLDELPIGFPATESGIEIRLLKLLFTLEEAKIATKLSFAYESLEDIYERVDKNVMSIEELENILDSMINKGAIHSKTEGNTKYYINAMFMIGMYDMQSHRTNIDDEHLIDFLKTSSQYFDEAMDTEMFSSGVPQFRIVPIEQSIAPIENAITNYEHIRRLIEDVEGDIVVARCVCRNKKDLYGEPCTHTELRETCFVLKKEFSQVYIDQGWGRAVSKEEALKILQKTEEAGLVYEIGNSQRPGSLCCCCGCCCGYLSDLKEAPNPLDYISSNYQAVIDSELCIGCETCIDRCLMDALTMVDDKSTVDLARCIGCGCCVPTCPADAIQLQKIDEEKIPPKDWDELYETIEMKKKELA